MGLADIMQITSGTRKVVAAMVALSVCFIIGVFSYYQYQNSAEDPRVKAAKMAYKKYGELMEKNNYDAAMATLNEIETTFRGTPGYKKSYEVGVVLNNRASIYLIKVETLGLEKSQEEMQIMAREMDLAETYATEAITIYEAWIKEYGSLSQEEIRRKITPFFSVSDPAFKGANVSRFIDKRVKEILTAQQETPRRLSVTLTNLGVVARYRHQQERAKEIYQRALALWPENYVADNNLRVLKGLQPKGRGVLDQMFPKQRVEK